MAEDVLTRKFAENIPFSFKKEKAYNPKENI